MGKRISRKQTSDSLTDFELSPAQVKRVEKADASVRGTACLTLRYRRAGEVVALRFPTGTDLWALLKRCDQWAAA